MPASALDDRPPGGEDAVGDAASAVLYDQNVDVATAGVAVDEIVGEALVVEAVGTEEGGGTEEFFAVAACRIRKPGLDSSGSEELYLPSARGGLNRRTYLALFRSWLSGMLMVQV
jgi:hypothetical protein